MFLIVSLTNTGASITPEMAELRERMQPLLQKYGAERVMSARVLPSRPDDPAEIHAMRLPSRAAYDAMCADPAYLALDNLRQVAMQDIRLIVAEEYITFLD